MADIFISYAREDREIAKTLAQALEDQGWSVWWDRRIRTGRRFHQVIERELAAARCVIALWSKAALSSYWVREEAQDGLDRDILVPARIEAILLPIGFRTIQTADLSHWAGDQAHPGFAQLVEDIAAALGEAPPGERVPNLEVKPEKPAQRAAEPKKVIDLRDLPDLAVFRDVDAPWYPELVALPAGDFLMGSPEDEEGCSDDESPQHRVTIGYRFAIGRYPVTYDEYDHFCTATKRKKPGDEGWGRGRRPVINVSWLDAQAYVEWLTKETSKPYRLPSEAEWEYACRAGTTTPFSYGETIITDQANYDSHYTYGKGAEGVYRWRRTTEVGSFAANPWGLYDMHGNVWEWVEDVWHGNYEGAPADGSPWTNVLGKESSSHRVLRGGSWEDDPRGGRSASRGRNQPDIRDVSYGFRVARTLD